jgi:hypothetical protein
MAALQPPSYRNLHFRLIASSHQKNSEIKISSAKIWHNQKMHIFARLWFLSEFLTIFLSKIAFFIALIFNEIFFNTP